MKVSANVIGVPDFEYKEFCEKKSDYCLLIPVLNEGERIQKQLRSAFEFGVPLQADIIICDGGSVDGSLDEGFLSSLGVNSLLIKKGKGKQSAQLRTGIWYAFQKRYKGIITVDGNNKDSMEYVANFIEKLDQGYDFVQGSRYLPGGKAINTPLLRHLLVKYVHAPIISLTAGYKFTDTTNAFRGYSARYLKDSRVLPLRDIFDTYELLAYLSVRASQLGMAVCEIPVCRQYPKGKIPTKISFFKGNFNLLKILILNFFRKYNP